MTTVDLMRPWSAQLGFQEHKLRGEVQQSQLWRLYLVVYELH